MDAAGLPSPEPGLTYTDPTYYTEPIAYRRSFVRGEADESLTEFSCEWNTPWVVAHLEPGPRQDWPQRQPGLRSGQPDRARPPAGFGLRVARDGLRVPQEQAQAIRCPGGEEVIFARGMSATLGVVALFVFAATARPPAQGQPPALRLRRRSSRSSSGRPNCAVATIQARRSRHLAGSTANLTYGLLASAARKGKPGGNMGKDEPTSSCRSLRSASGRSSIARITPSTRKRSASSAASPAIMPVVCRSRSFTRRIGLLRSTSTTPAVA